VTFDDVLFEIMVLGVFLLTHWTSDLLFLPSMLYSLSRPQDMDHLSMLVEVKLRGELFIALKAGPASCLLLIKVVL